MEKDAPMTGVLSSIGYLLIFAFSQIVGGWCIGWSLVRLAQKEYVACVLHLLGGFGCMWIGAALLKYTTN